MIYLFIVPVPACAGMTKEENDLGPVVKPRDDKKARDDKGFGLFFFLLCHSGARPRNPGGARETRVQKYFYNPCSRLRGMTKEK